MTEDQIERIVERMMDALEQEYVTTFPDQAYNWRVKEIDNWAKAPTSPRSLTPTQRTNTDGRRATPHR